MKFNLKKLSWTILVLLILIFLSITIVNTKKNLNVKSNQIEFLEKNLKKKKITNKKCA